jgi:ABC-type cobalt transport system substrate-binding protein
MSEAEAYLRELRRALPLGCRRRLVAEVREHFASAIAAEAENGIGRAEAERLTIERLGPARTLADQLLTDLRSGVLGRRARVSATLTTARLVLVATVIAIAVAVGAVAVGKHTHQASPTPPPQRPPRLRLIVDPRSGEVRPVLMTLQAAVQRHQTGQSSTAELVVRPVIYPTPAR